MYWITLTRISKTGNQTFMVNASHIDYFHHHPEQGSIVALASGGQLHVTETPAEILTALPESDPGR